MKYFLRHLQSRHKHKIDRSLTSRQVAQTFSPAGAGSIGGQDIQMLFISGLKDDAPDISRAQSHFYYLLNLDSRGFSTRLITYKF